MKTYRVVLLKKDLDTDPIEQDLQGTAPVAAARAAVAAAQGSGEIVEAIVIELDDGVLGDEHWFTANADGTIN